ncbi:MAG: ABC transporter permease [SAR202 cluster bacterium]|jgi:peptide/nickel transport system permease protein|nr:ABC transporter permease [SAR202 cluster bacterium]
MGLTVGYVVRRFCLFALVVWVGASLNFFVPRLAPGDPAAAMISRMEAAGGRVEDPAALIAEYREIFGLDEPLWVQYAVSMRNLFKFEFGLSISQFPANVRSLIINALPWTTGLLLTTLLISFTIGSIIGALMVWPGGHNIFKLVSPISMVFAAIPYYLMALLLLWVLAFNYSVFPSFGAGQVGKSLEGLDRFVEIIYYSMLPGLSIVISSIGLWAVTMRGIMVTTLGEDFLLLAKAKGISASRIFFWYGMRNAMLPQTTGLAIAVGQILAGSVIVEILFSYPGIGHLLYKAIGMNDYPLIQGITFLMILSAAGAVLIMDLIYPRLDPRITYTSN